MSKVNRTNIAKAHPPLPCLLMGDSSIVITEIAHARFLVEIGDVEEIAAPNFMGIETAKEYVDFTFWRRASVIISQL